MTNQIKLKKMFEEYLKKINIVAFIICLIHFFVTTYTDTIIFNNVDYMASKLYYVFKLIVLFALYIFWQVVFKFINEVKCKKVYVIAFLKFFGIYMLFMCVMLLFTWPGVWRWDDIFRLVDFARNINFDHWQHWLTSAFYIFSLCIFPFPAGIVFIQIFIISCIVGWIMVQFYRFFPEKKVYLFYIPLLFPSIIENNLFPLRLPLYGFLEVLLYVLLIYKFYSKTQFSYKNAFTWGVLLGIVGSWRSESIIYFIIFPILLCVILKQNISYRCLFVFICTFLLCGVSVITVQSSDGKGNTYLLSAIIQPLGEIIKTDFNSDNVSEDLKIINSIISVEEIKRSGGISTMWSTGVADEILSDEEIDSIKKVYIKLVFKNLPQFIKERLISFKNSNRSLLDSAKLYNTTNIFPGYESPSIRTFLSNFLFNTPPNKELREKTIYFLECRSYDGNQKTIFFNLFYNPVIGVIIFVAILVIGTFKRNKLFVLVSLSILMKTGVIVLTAPDTLFMYYLPLLLCSYILPIIFWYLNGKEIKL